MKLDDLRVAILDDLRQRGPANAHEMALNPQLGFVPLFSILLCLNDLADDGLIELVSTTGIAASGKVQIRKGAI